MKKRFEVTDPKSCLSKAGEFETLFVLLGRDRAASATIRFWCQERIRLSKNEVHDQQITSALDCADQMEKEAR